MASIQTQGFVFDFKLACSEQNFTTLPEGIFDDLKFLVRLSNELGCKPMPNEEDERRNRIYQNFVSQCLAQASRSLLTPAEANISELKAIRSVQLGKILFSYILCPSMSVSGVYCQSIAVALRACLETGCDELESPVRWSPEVLCWLLVSGAMTNQVNTLQMWYRRRVADFVRYQKLQNFDQLEAMLRKVVWAGDEFGAACRTIWMDNMALQISEE